ncbi:hypothetical protein NLU13_1888 [Sarocladium strictum]|uniref:Uncharacterized protein n=1 Tax=Sarocladium strictum TaxID=5046 RepID=A0AA39GRS3_SARSR|nr:hypothetical protein NLU13_1888 [Sarocladium strictum]
MRSDLLLSGLWALACPVLADPTWPSEIDELEEIMFQLTSFGARKFADTVSPCSNEASGPGRLNAAEWLRTAFHDMSTANTFFATGGLDASLQYELENGENTGPGHRTTLEFMAPYMTSRSSLSDLLAMGVYHSVRSCGGPIVPIRAGRKDATTRGNTGVPQPQNSVLTFQQQFERMGFTNAEMIQVTACGHTIGGVHEAEFPDIVSVGSTPDGMSPLDSSEATFDNRVVTEYLDGNTTNPLVVGPAVRTGKHADFKVFNSDGNVTMRGLTDPETFKEVCKTVLQKMVDVVPPGVILTDPIEPYKVKPVDLQLSLTAGGTALLFTGYIRVKTTGLGDGAVETVKITYKNRDGESNCGSASCTIESTVQGVGQGFDDTFAFFPIEATIPATTGISSFTVALIYADGSEEEHDNNGNDYPLQDDVLFQTPQSCVLGSTGALTVVAAVRNAVADNGAEARITYKMSQERSPIPTLRNGTMKLTRGRCAGQYTLYSAQYMIQGGLAHEATLDLSSGSKSDSFKRVADVGGTCREFANPVPCNAEDEPSASDSTTLPPVTTGSTTKIETPTTTSDDGSITTSTVAEPIASPYHRETMGEYNLVSCWTEGNGTRALSGPTLADDNMTLEVCMDFCAEYVYWGTEYGRECYCGDTLASSSDAAPLLECNMLCRGNTSQYCGAGNRLELYSTTAPQPTPTSSSPTAVPDPVHRDQIGDHTLVGCWTEGIGVRALAEGSSASGNMTNELCAVDCAAYRYFGTQFSTECFCGSFIHPSATSAPLDDCSMPCGGNTSEFCGGPNRLELYMNTDIVGGEPEQPAAAGEFIYQGCRMEGVNGTRALADRTTSGDGMTNAACAEFCGDFVFMGTQFGRECYCGNTLSEGALQAEASECGMLCSGTALEFCGGPNRLSIYQKEVLMEEPDAGDSDGV